MDTKLHLASAEKSWLARHPLLVIGAMLAVCLGPFLNQAIQTDDTLFVWTAQWIQKHPGDFFGFKVNWWGSTIPMWTANWNPPLLPYLLAGAGTLFGWHEVALHLTCLAIAFAAAAGIYALAGMWCDRPMLASVIAVLTPAFLILSTTLMCDMLMLACWTWAVVFWERASTGGQSRWLYLGAGVLAGLAVLSKYSAVTLLPLLPILSILRPGKPGWGMTGMAVPIVMLAGYEWWTARLYGHGLLSLASHYARSFRFDFPGGWHAKAIIGLAFAGGSLLPVLFLTPWLWRRRTWLAGGMVILGGLLAIFWLGGDPGIVHPWVDPDGSLMKLWGFRLQVLLFMAAGLQVVLLAGTEIWQRRDRITLALVLWIGSVFFFATVLNWTVNARSFLPAVPALAILAVRRLQALRKTPDNEKWLIWPLAPAAVIVFSLAMANFQLANSARTAAERILAEYKTPDHTLWFDGHGGFQYYMEKFGGQPLDVERSLLVPGDMVAVAMLGNFVVLPPESVAPVKNVSLQLHSWLNLHARNARGAAGFYTSDAGPVPFVLGAIQPQAFFVVKVFSRLQYQSQPANPQEVLAGAVPAFPHMTYSLDNGPAVAENPAATEQIRLARQLEQDGKLETAVQVYQAALNVESNNPVALNGLAWILATTSQPELRDTKKAVQLAMRAVKLTDWRRAVMIQTFATAYAADGQYAKAKFVAQFALNLAIITGQSDVAADSAKLISMCTAATTALLDSSPPGQK